MLMGNKDQTQKRLEDFSDIFADIINALLFNGEEIIKADELETITAKDTYTVESKIHEIERDVAKRWKHNEIHLSLFGLENQTDPDPTMPMRVICYDGSAYRAQLNKKTTKAHYPVITLVLYMDTEEHWNKPKRLIECFQVDKKLKRYVNDYKINVVELAWLSDKQIMKFKSEFRNFVELLRDTRLGRKPQYSPIQLKHVHELLQLMRVMSGNNEYEKLLNNTHDIFQHTKIKGDELTMKKIVYYGFDEAAAKAQMKEKFATVKRMLKLGKSSLADISEITELPLATVKEIQAEMHSL